MGYTVGAQCWSTVDEAANVLYGAAPPLITSTGYQAFEKISGVWYLDVYKINGTKFTLQTKSAVTPIFPPCDLGQRTHDGLQLGMLTITPAILAWCVVVLKRTLFT